MLSTTLQMRPKTSSRKRSAKYALVTNPADTPKATITSVSSLASSADRPDRMSAQGSLEVFDNPVYYQPEQPAGDQQMMEELIDVAAAQFPAGINMDLVGEGDDEAMVELAIALSLQEQNAGAGGAQQPAGMLAQAAAAMVGVAAMQGQAGAAARGASMGDHYSDATSDDEASTAATDGSTLRTSPPPVVDNDNDSESGGSPVESIVDGGATPATRTQSREVPDSDRSADPDDLIEASNAKLHKIRIALLERLIEALPDVRQVGGVHCIPFMQVMLMLSSDLDSASDGENDKRIMALLLNSLLVELQYSNDRMTERTPNHEVKLIIMRLLSILMSRVKSSSSSSKDFTNVHSTTLTAQSLINSNILDLCLDMLISLLSYWKQQQTVDEEQETQSQRGTTVKSGTLQPHTCSTPPDMSPFFLKQYVRGHAEDVFELYPQLLTEMILRLPYQLKKISFSITCKYALEICLKFTETLAKKPPETTHVLFVSYNYFSTSSNSRQATAYATICNVL